MLRPGRKWCAALMVAVFLALPGVTWGDGFSQEVGLRFGYGKSTKKTSVHIYSLLPHWGIFLVRPGNTTLGGVSLSFVVEGIISGVNAESSGFELGFTPMLKARLPLGPRFQLFVEGGAGMITESFDSPALAHAFNFTPQVGGGVEVALRPNLGWLVAYRFRHSSNAGLYKENPAFNVNFVHTGLTYYY